MNTFNFDNTETQELEDDLLDYASWLSELDNQDVFNLPSSMEQVEEYAELPESNHTAQFNQNSIKKTTEEAQGFNKEYFKSFVSIILQPEVGKAVNNFYESYMNINPQIYSKSTEIISIDKPADYEFIVNLKVIPINGENSPVGIDLLTFNCSENGIILDSFEHHEPYEE